MSHLTSSQLGRPIIPARTVDKNIVKLLSESFDSTETETSLSCASDLAPSDLISDNVVSSVTLDEDHVNLTFSLPRSYFSNLSLSILSEIKGTDFFKLVKSSGLTMNCTRITDRSMSIENEVSDTSSGESEELQRVNCPEMAMFSKVCCTTAYPEVNSLDRRQDMSDNNNHNLRNSPHALNKVVQPQINSLENSAVANINPDETILENENVENKMDCNNDQNDSKRKVLHSEESEPKRAKMGSNKSDGEPTEMDCEFSTTSQVIETFNVQENHDLETGSSMLPSMTEYRNAHKSNIANSIDNANDITDQIQTSTSMKTNYQNSLIASTYSSENVKEFSTMPSKFISCPHLLFEDLELLQTEEIETKFSGEEIQKYFEVKGLSETIVIQVILNSGEISIKAGKLIHSVEQRSLNVTTELDKDSQPKSVSNDHVSLLKELPIDPQSESTQLDISNIENKNVELTELETSRSNRNVSIDDSSKDASQQDYVSKNSLPIKISKPLTEGTLSRLSIEFKSPSAQDCSPVNVKNIYTNISIETNFVPKDFSACDLIQEKEKPIQTVNTQQSLSDTIVYESDEDSNITLSKSEINPEDDTFCEYESVSEVDSFVESIKENSKKFSSRIRRVVIDADKTHKKTFGEVREDHVDLLNESIEHAESVVDTQSLKGEMAEVLVISKTTDKVPDGGAISKDVEKITKCGATSKEISKIFKDVVNDNVLKINKGSSFSANTIDITKECAGIEKMCNVPENYTSENVGEIPEGYDGGSIGNMMQNNAQSESVCKITECEELYKNIVLSQGKSLSERLLDNPESGSEIPEGYSFTKRVRKMLHSDSSCESTSGIPDEESSKSVCEMSEDDALGESVDKMPKIDALSESVSEMPDCGTLSESVSEMPDCSALSESVSEMPDCGALTEGVSEMPEGDTLSESVNEMPEGDTLSESVSEMPVDDTLSESVSEMPEGDSLSERVSEMPEGDSLSESVSEMPEGDALSESVSEMPEGDALSESVSDMPEGDALGESVSDMPEGDALDESVSEMPESDALGESVSEMPESDALGKSVSEMSEGDALGESVSEMPEGDDLSGNFSGMVEGYVMSESVEEIPEDDHLSVREIPVEDSFSESMNGITKDLALKDHTKLSHGTYKITNDSMNNFIVGDFQRTVGKKIEKEPKSNNQTDLCMASVTYAMNIANPSSKNVEFINKVNTTESVHIIPKEVSNIFPQYVKRDNMSTSPTEYKLKRHVSDSSEESDLNQSASEMPEGYEQSTICEGDSLKDISNNIQLKNICYMPEADAHNKQTSKVFVNETLPENIDTSGKSLKAINFNKSILESSDDWNLDTKDLKESFNFSFGHKKIELHSSSENNCSSENKLQRAENKKIPLSETENKLKVLSKDALNRHDKVFPRAGTCFEESRNLAEKSQTEECESKDGDDSEDGYELYKVSLQPKKAEHRSARKVNSFDNSPEITTINSEDSEAAYLNIDSDTNESLASTVGSEATSHFTLYGTNSADVSDSDQSNAESIQSNAESVDSKASSNSKSSISSREKNLKQTIKSITSRNAKIKTSASEKGKKKPETSSSRKTSSKETCDEIDAAPTRLRTKHFPASSLSEDVIPENAQVIVEKKRTHLTKGKKTVASDPSEEPSKRNLRSKSLDPSPTAFGQKVANRRGSADTERKTKLAETHSALKERLAVTARSSPRKAPAVTDSPSSINSKTDSRNVTEVKRTRKRAETPDTVKERLSVTVRSSPRKAVKSAVDRAQSLETLEESSTSKGAKALNETEKTKAKGKSKLNSSKAVNGSSRTRRGTSKDKNEE